MAAESGGIDALGQFKLFPVLDPVGSAIYFTQANLAMLIVSGIILAFMYLGARPAAIIPGRLQASAEAVYEFVRGMCTDQIGPEGKDFFPFVFTLFTFILLGNVVGLVPYSFTFTSHIAVTGALAILVFLLVTVVAIRTHGLHFFTYFFPAGAPKALAPLIIPVEVISYLSRPVSLSIRLFANMVAGHVMLAVFSSFVVMLAGLGIAGAIGGVLPLALNVVLIGFELLVAFLQAYVFAILTCIYLHDAVHLH